MPAHFRLKKHRKAKRSITLIPIRISEVFSLGNQMDSDGTNCYAVRNISFSDIEHSKYNLIENHSKV